MLEGETIYLNIVCSCGFFSSLLLKVICVCIWNIRVKENIAFDCLKIVLMLINIELRQNVVYHAGVWIVHRPAQNHSFEKKKHFRFLNAHHLNCFKTSNWTLSLIKFNTYRIIVWFQLFHEWKEWEEVNKSRNRECLNLSSLSIENRMEQCTLKRDSGSMS